jgi:diguanylate cyclase (GGDEF)-like protein/PAS domain S-box-containing protein
MENRHINILAIDDNADNLISIKALVGDGFPKATVYLANTGQKGLDIALEILPDVILLDIVMPDMDGFSVCRKLKADPKLNEIPVVFLTAIKGDKESRIKALECGAEAFLAKPIDESELRAQIRAMVKIREANILKHDEKQRLAYMVEAKTAELTIALRFTSQLVEELRMENEARQSSEAELMETKQYLEKLFSFSSAPILVWNEKFEITKLNKAFEKIIGKNSQELMGISMLSLFSKQKLNEIAATLEEVRLGKDIEAVEVEIKHKDGSVKTVLWSTATLFEPDDSRKFTVIAQGQDITQRLEAEKNLLQMSFHDHLTGLYNRRFFEEELSRLDTERNLPISIIMGDINGLKLINDSFGHAAGDELLKKTAYSMKQFFREDDIIARLGGDEFVILLPKTDAIEAEKIIQRIRDYISKEKVMNIDLSVSFGFETKRTKEETIIDSLKKAEDSMYRVKLYENKSIRSKTIDVIMDALVEKSQRELMHSRRVSSVCERIAQEMQLQPDFINQIRIAGLIHDIGKIGIDEKILNKPGALDEEEWVAMKKHPEAGWRILNSVSEFSELSEFVLSHHERWDGTGYPRGLKAEQIPIEARIIMIADSYDAMTSMRSYRTALSHDEAILELKRYAGIQFDPLITRLFVEKVLGDKWE